MCVCVCVCVCPTPSLTSSTAPPNPNLSGAAAEVGLERDHVRIHHEKLQKEGLGVKHRGGGGKWEWTARPRTFSSPLLPHWI